MQVSRRNELFNAFGNERGDTSGRKLNPAVRYHCQAVGEMQPDGPNARYQLKFWSLGDSSLSGSNHRLGIQNEAFPDEEFPDEESSHGI